MQQKREFIKVRRINSPTHEALKSIRKVHIFGIGRGAVGEKLRSFLSGDDYICPGLVCKNVFQVRPEHGSFKYVDVQQIQAESLVPNRGIAGTSGNL